MGKTVAIELDAGIVRSWPPVAAKKKPPKSMDGSFGCVGKNPQK
jgi:hypothetical protein